MLDLEIVIPTFGVVLILLILAYVMGYLIGKREARLDD